MAQAVSHLLLTREDKVRAQVGPCEMCDRQIATGAGLS